MTPPEKPLKESIKFMEEFALRTGLSGKEGDIDQRYLWTDAFAVQTFFGLEHASKIKTFREKAIHLIHTVHEKLGRFHPDDPRKGWNSGLSEEEGNKHPTAGGLRIGKKMLERKKNEHFNERMEWDRDGQYFHYISRWINALLKAGQETADLTYAGWAAELLKACEKFVDKSIGRTRMYWKMSVDLSRPLISNMGAHDPLEGLICAKSIIHAVPEKAQDLAVFISDMEQLCRGRNWFTTDDLGIGGLLLNAIRVSELSKEKELPEAIKPEKLMAESLEGIRTYAQTFDQKRPAHLRLGFRECGLSLGLRALLGLKDPPKATAKLFDELLSYLSLADQIEDFWRIPDNRQSPTWTEHLDINEVTLASSLGARYRPDAYNLSGDVP